MANRRSVLPSRGRDFRNEVEIIDEAVAAAVFDAVTQGDDGIADRSPGAAHDPGPRERFACGNLPDGGLACCGVADDRPRYEMHAPCDSNASISAFCTGSMTAGCGSVMWALHPR